jgi:hypothetical protein
MVLLGDESQVELIAVCLEIVLISMPNRFTVCAERTVGLEIILDGPNGTPGGMAHVESCFGPFRDGVSVEAR